MTSVKLVKLLNKITIKIKSTRRKYEILKFLKLKDFQMLTN